ncbi:exodeoxyribonuclease III [Parvibaculum sp.]|uniref:exodeoxyribonuclease III n=1 Tax=Parvibaculum sp. TaxID=2024848 RepID=UPI002CFFF3F3|nr:exodeoxyribonuclease III [Parvibaculum sp.]HUD53312.1 exodeoxyribonuclease III [Parvibaculum sp.]
MDFKLATWNINSVRLRINLVEKVLSDHAPDVLCLQEIKCVNDAFPLKAIQKAGYEHVAVNGQKGYHGVAILSRIPFKKIETKGFCEKGDARHLSVDLDVPGGLTVHNFYVPAGGDEPDPEINEKFAHKLAFMREMTQWYDGMKRKNENRMALVGDLNVAPLEHDVWSHKQLLKVVSHTPVEVELMNEVIASHDWIDVMRRFVPAEEKLYSWWSYRAKDWAAADRGRRLDHIWVTPALGEAPQSMQVLREARGWERASDHVPVIATLKL